MRNRKSKIKNPQDIQDEIFRKMSADRKIELGAQLWLLAKELIDEKLYYETESRTKSSKSKISISKYR